MISRCTRWFLPLLLLPLPTAPPYFLMLFLFSLTLHARPCFYCIILLTALFVSSCYWPPLPLSNTLSVPWSENITTFADALNASLSKPDTPLPSVVHVTDRCWCDFSTGSIFEPFNLSNWEWLSVESMKEELEQKKDGEQIEGMPQESDSDGSGSSETEVNLAPSIEEVEGATLTPQAIVPPNPHHLTDLSGWLPISSLFTRKSKRTAPDHPPSVPSPPQPAEQPFTSAIDAPTPPPPPTQHDDLPLLRWVYDLRPYGFDLIVDFGWSRTDMSS